MGHLPPVHTAGTASGFHPSRSSLLAKALLLGGHPKAYEYEYDRICHTPTSVYKVTRLLLRVASCPFVSNSLTWCESILMLGIAHVHPQSLEPVVQALPTIRNFHAPLRVRPYSPHRMFAYDGDFRYMQDILYSPTRTALDSKPLGLAQS